jgi:hypothetical protein
MPLTEEFDISAPQVSIDVWRERKPCMAFQSGAGYRRHCRGGHSGVLAIMGPATTTEPQGMSVFGQRL